MTLYRRRVKPARPMTRYPHAMAPIFGLLSSTGTRVDIFSDKSFFDPDKKINYPRAKYP